MKYEMLNQTGETVGNVDLLDDVFDVEARPDLVHTVMVAQLAANRAATAHVKNRSAVRGGGAKPYRQKGTGHARQGTIRAGQFRGGGVIFGPSKNRNYTKKLTRKMRRKALISCLSDKARNSEMKVLETIEFEEYRTKNVAKILSDLGVKGQKTLFLMSEKNDFFKRSVKNIPNVKVIFAGSVNVYDVIYHENLIITKEAAEYLGEVYGK